MLLYFSSWCPGVLGLLLRQKLYPLFLKNCGRKVLFGRFVTLKGARKISIGNGVVINDYAILNAEKHEQNGNGILLEDNVFIGAGTQIVSLGEKIIIKRNSNLGSECRVIADNKSIIDENVLIAAFCQIGGTLNKQHEDHFRNDKNNQTDDNCTQIGYGCWLGVRTILRSGVQVGKETIVGAHSVVEDQLPSYIVAVGNPAQLLYSRK